MATQEITLTTDWQEITIDAGFIGQCPQFDTILVRNDDAMPTSKTLPAHSVTEEVNLVFPVPSSGSWYARIPYVTPRSPDVVLIYTEL